MVPPKNPDAPLQIHLDGGDKPNRIYSNNDVVSGVVKVDTRLKAQDVSISFEGKAVSRLPRKSTTSLTGGSASYKTIEGTSMLLHYAEKLFSGDDIASYATEGDPFVSFPFKFRFPLVVQGDVARGTNLDPSPNFEHEPGHPLPPSMTAEVANHYQAIQYYVEARMPAPPSKIISTSKTEKQLIQFVPSCIDHPVATTTTSSATNEHIVTVTRHSRHLDPSHSPPGGHLLSHLKDLIPSSSDPHATFSITTRTPATARGGSILGPVVFTVALVEHSPELPGPPALHLRGFSVALKAVTKSRVQHATLAHGSELAAQNAYNIRLAERHWHPEKNEGKGQPPLLPVAGGVEVSVAQLTETGSIVVGTDVVPSFKTYGVARAYLLKVVLWIECGGKAFEIDAAAQPVEVLPWPDMRGDGRSGGEEQG